MTIPQVGTPYKWRLVQEHHLYRLITLSVITRNILLARDRCVPGWLEEPCEGWTPWWEIGEEKTAREAGVKHKAC